MPVKAEKNAAEDVGGHLVPRDGDAKASGLDVLADGVDVPA
jgi:hypothetical protein